MKIKKFLALLIIFAILTLLICSPNQYYFGPKSDHFDGLKFFDKNNHDKKLSELIHFLKIKNGSHNWPEDFSYQDSKIPECQVTGNKINITYVNHDTFLIQTEGLNILTDPIWSQRASPISFIGPKRVINPGIAFNNLPKIDYVLISHNHYDHLDIPTLKLLQKTSNPKILAGLGICYYLNVKKDLRLNCSEMDWNESYNSKNNKLQFIFTKARHWSKRSLFDTRATLWGAFIIKTSKGNIYFAGDTGYGNHFVEARKKYGKFIASLLPIGAHEPREFMKENHLNPADAILAHKDLASDLSIAMHFGTFKLGTEEKDQPQIELKELLEKEKIKNFVVLKPGENIVVK